MDRFLKCECVNLVPLKEGETAEDAEKRFIEAMKGAGVLFTAFKKTLVDENMKKIKEDTKETKE